MAGRRLVPLLLIALLSGLVGAGPATGAATGAVTVVDPAGDVAAGTYGDLPPTDPRVDLLGYTISYGEFVTIMVRTAVPDASVMAAIEIRLDDGAGLDHGSDFRVRSDGLTQFVEGTGDVRRCDVSSGMVGSAYVLQFKATCLGAPPAVRVPFGFSLTHRVGDPAGRDPYTGQCMTRCAPFAVYQDSIAGSGPVARRLGADPFVLAPPTVAVAIVGTPSGKGYWVARSDGRVTAHGDAPDVGGARTDLNWPIVGASGTPTGRGLWLTARDGGVFTSGDARFFGSLDGAAYGFDGRVVGVAPAANGGGYWLAAFHGRVFPFGDAPDLGSWNRALNAPILGIRATPTGLGYWLIASDGGIFTFGDAAFHGSTGSLQLNKPVVGMAPTPTGHGYWLVAADGGVFTFGDAAFHGSTGSLQLNKPVVGMAPTPTGQGYWLVAADGGVFTFGDAAFHGAALLG